MNTFIWPVRIYYEDTDSGGLVYYANYLKFMERARTEWLRRLGYEQDRLLREYGIIFAVRKAELDYHQPAHFNELLNVSVSLSRPGKASLTFYQEVKRTEDNALLCSGHIRIACVDLSAMRPVSIPKNLLQEIMDAE